MADRRDTLKIIGAIGTTCAFPFSAGDLYGQHVHATPSPPAASGPYRPLFFTAAEFATLSALVDTIIPPTDTPGAAAAGVPQYIDLVVQANPEHQNRFRAGLQLLDGACSAKFHKPYRDATEDERIAILTPWSESKDSEEPRARFFRLAKNLTADGYYTSQIGLVRELQYKGNAVLPQYPFCNHPEHHG